MSAGERWDVLVVGGGPGGLMAALQAARLGSSVMVLERKGAIGRPVRCGEGTLISALEYLDLAGERWVRNYMDYIRLHILDLKPVRLDIKGLGFVVTDRTSLECEIARRVQEEGGCVSLGKAVTGVEGSELVLADGSTVAGKVIIGADGVESMIGRRLGIVGPLPLDHIGTALTSQVVGGAWETDTAELYFGRRTIPSGYAWIFPKSGGLANAGIGGVAVDYKGSGNLVQHYERFREGHLGGCEVLETSCGAVPLAPPPESVVKGNALLVGDAARHVYSLGGGGIHTALFDGFVAGRVASSYASGAISSLARYDTHWRRACYADLRGSHRGKELIYPSDANKVRLARVLRLVSWMSPLASYLFLRMRWKGFEREMDLVSRTLGRGR